MPRRKGMLARLSCTVTATAALMFGLSVTGCTPKTKASPKSGPVATTDADGKREIAKSDTAHEGWWCQEHGVPEEICSLCSASAAAKFKKEGDWCKEHDRALSQCFKCDPTKYDKYEAMYVAKYGKKPERPPEE